MLRLGVTNDVDLAPLFFPIEAGWAPTPAGLITKNGLPYELETRLLDGELDIAPVNPLTYARNQDKIYLLPFPVRAYDISADAIFLISKKRLDKYEKPKITLAHSSDLGEAILKLLSRIFYSIEPQFQNVATEVAALDSLRNGTDICIISGETGMRAVGAAKARGYFVEDLTKAYWLCFELPLPLFLFGVRKGWTETEPNATILARATMQMFKAALLRSREQMETLAERNEKRTGLPADALAEHYGLQRYEFNQNHLRGLLDFYRRSAILLISPPVLDLNFYPLLETTAPIPPAPPRRTIMEQPPVLKQIKDKDENRPGLKPRAGNPGENRSGREKAEAQGFRVIKGGKDPNPEQERLETTEDPGDDEA